MENKEMEKPKEEKQTQNSETKIQPEEEMKKSNQPKVVWDCESSLYDSFELKSFERQLDSAISARTLSMPHLSSSDHRKPPPPQQKPPSKKPSRFLLKLIRSVFQPKRNNNNNSSIYNDNYKGSKSSSWFRVEKGSLKGVYYIYDTSGALTTIPENTVGDFDGRI